MNQQERSMIEGLFERLQQAEAQAGPRDAEAESLIRDLMSRQDAAPYLLAQVVLVQEQGLQQLNQRVESLERELAERPQGGGFLGGLFGGGRPQPAAPAAARSAAGTGAGWSNARSPASAQVQRGFGAQPGAQGGGFMAGAMQTAVGVACVTVPARRLRSSDCSSSMSSRSSTGCLEPNATAPLCCRSPHWS